MYNNTKTIVVVTLLLLSTTLLSLVSGQADGNPHHWDRRRRCDQTDYSPPCGACEGYGGIPYGDENDQIHLTTCEIIQNATGIKNPVKPVWGKSFTLRNYNEILIGPKLIHFVSMHFHRIRRKESCAIAPTVACKRTMLVGD